MEFILREPDVNASAVRIRRASIDKAVSYRVSVNDQGENGQMLTGRSMRQKVDSRQKISFCLLAMDCT